MAPSPFTVRRWKRYGHDRLYIDGLGGSAVGWLSLTTGELTVIDDDDYDEVLAILRNEEAAIPWLIKLQPLPIETPVVAESHGDLATNRPGETIRTRADQALDAMRDQSRFFTAIARVFDIKTDERAWRKGAQGEETVGLRLERLVEDGWRILHSVPVGNRGSDIDHVLIGPGGVYTINTKLHPGKRIWVGANSIRVNGRPVPYLRNSRFEAERAGRMLSAATSREIDVRPVLVLLTGSVVPNITIKQRPADVLIFDRVDIPRVFRRVKRCLDESEVAAIFEVALSPRTLVRASPRTGAGTYAFLRVAAKR